MKTTDYISNIIDRLPKGYVFTYSDFYTEVNKKEAVIKALNRMANSSKIAKLAKGKYYKPENTPFGNIQPKQAQIVKDLLENEGKIIGYLTGNSIYNQLGLTTQISNTIQIAKNEVRPAFKRERYVISFLKQKNTITKENIPLLQLLDAIRYIKKIPDSTVENASKRLLSIIQNLNDREKSTMVRLALKYPPATRAILGTFLEELKEIEMIEPLKKSLNPITKYKLAGLDKVVSISENWNIV